MCALSVFVIVPGCPNKPGWEHVRACSLYSARLNSVWATCYAAGSVLLSVSRPTSPHADIKGSQEAVGRVCHVSPRRGVFARPVRREAGVRRWPGADGSLFVVLGEQPTGSGSVETAIRLRDGRGKACDTAACATAS